MSYESIPLHDVVSKNLQAIGYDAHSRTVAVTFAPKKNGDVDRWHYPNVDAELWERFSTAPSVGSAFHHMIRPRSGVDAGRRVATYHADGTQTWYPETSYDEDEELL